MFGFREKKQNECSCKSQNVDEQGKSSTIVDESVDQKKDINSEQMDACLSELSSLKETYLRLVADFQNYKKRSELERIDRIEKTKADLFLGIITIVDNFDRALDEARKVDNPELQQWLVGFEMINKIFYDFLKQHGVESLQKTEMFDPLFHEAIVQIESPDHKEGAIVEVFEKGFLYKDKLLRTAKVSVAK